MRRKVLHSLSVLVLIATLLSYIGPIAPVFAEELATGTQTETTVDVDQTSESPLSEEITDDTTPVAPSVEGEPSDGETTPDEEPPANNEGNNNPSSDTNEGKIEDVGTGNNGTDNIDVQEEKPVIKEYTDDQTVQEGNLEENYETPGLNNPDGKTVDLEAGAVNPDGTIGMGPVEDFVSLIMVRLNNANGSVKLTFADGTYETYKFVTANIYHVRDKSGNEYDFHIGGEYMIAAVESVGASFSVEVEGKLNNYVVTASGVSEAYNENASFTVDENNMYIDVRFTGPTIRNGGMLKALPRGRGTTYKDFPWTEQDIDNMSYQDLIDLENYLRDWAFSQGVPNNQRGTAKIKWTDGHNGSDPSKWMYRIEILSDVIFTIQGKTYNLKGNIYQGQCVSPGLDSSYEGLEATIEFGLGGILFTTGWGEDKVEHARAGAKNILNQGGFSANIGYIMWNDGAGYQNVTHAPIETQLLLFPSGGTIQITKKSANPTLTNNNACYSLAGTTFEVRKEGTNELVGTLVVKADGTVDPLEVEAGTYIVTETKAGKGYRLPTRLEDRQEEVVVTAGETATVEFVNQPGNDPSRIQIQKVDPNTSKEIPEGIASFEGAEFTLKYWDNAQRSGTPKMVITYRTNSSGRFRLQDKTAIVSGTPYTSNSGEVIFPIGWYSIEETKAPTGYNRQTTIAYATVTEDTSSISGTKWTWDSGSVGGLIVGNTMTEEFAQIYQAKPIFGSVKVKKTDSTTNEPLEGAVFAICNGSTTDTVYKGVSFAPNAQITTITTNASGEASLSEIPYGKYYIKELTAPTGYSLNTSWRKDFTITTNGQMFDYSSEPVTNDMIRGDINFLKLANDGSYLPNIPFWIIRYDDAGNEIERHVLVSDANGKVDTSNANRAHNNNTNSLDQYVSGGVFQDSSKLDSSVGVWFGPNKPGGASAPVDNTKGALPYGRYKIVEIKVKDAEVDYNLIQSPYIDVTEPNVNVTTNPIINLEIEMTSNALEPESGTKVLPANGTSTVQAQDTLNYTSLTKGGAYRMQFDFVTKSNPNVVLATTDVPFNPEGRAGTNVANGTIVANVDIDTSGYEGETIAVMGYLYQQIDDNEVLISVHNADLRDANQELYIPKISTTASDGSTRDHVGTIGEEAVIIDVIEYENVQASRQYKMVGKLQDADTGEYIKGTNGEDLVVEHLFYARRSSGTVTMPEFRFNASEFEGRSIVVVEELYRINDEDDSEILTTTHTELDDEDQTVHFIEVKTTATDANTGNHVGTVGTLETIYDLVTINNTVPGMEYKVSGDLYYQSDFTDKDGVEHKKGDKVPYLDGSISETTVTATGNVTTITLSYIVDSTLFEGTTVVVFEDVYHNDVLIGKHHDIDDEEQSVHYPKIGTLAKDSATGTHTGAVGETATIVDTISYENLIPEQEYIFRGILTYLDNGDIVLDENGEEISVYGEPFTPTEPNGTFDIEFTFKSELLRGRSVVVCEYLTVAGATKDVAKHADLTDKGQTINYPDLGTTAADSETLDHVGKVGESVTIRDTVKFTNLTVGETVTIKGTLWTKEPEEQLPYTAETTFVVETANGEVELVFEGIDSTVLAGKTVVAFESLYQEDVEVVVHADIEDDDQSVDYPDVKTNAVDGVTQTHTGLVNTKVTIVDTVTYTNTRKDATYTILGVLMDAETGEKILVNGKEVIATAVLKAGEHEADGTIDLVYTLDSTALRGKTVVVFEDLIHNDIKVASHADLKDEAQSIDYPDIRTKAIDKTTGNHFIAKGEKTVFVDTITYKNLNTEATYIVRGTMMDKATGKALLINGKTITAESEPFQPTSKNGELTLEFDVDATDLEDITVVVFEKLFEIVVDTEEEREVVTHEDLEDKEQSLYVPKIRTKATSKDTGNHFVPLGINVGLNDTVTYTNLMPGEQYTLIAELMDEATGKAVLDGKGKPYKVEFAFVAQESNGSVVVPLNVDSTKLEGRTLVFFETLMYDGNEIAEHKDLKDKDQTIIVTRVPNTGDTRGMWTALSVFMLSINGIVLLLDQRKKRREEEQATLFEL